MQHEVEVIDREDELLAKTQDDFPYTGEEGLMPSAGTFDIPPEMLVHIPLEEVGDGAHIVRISDITLDNTQVIGSQPQITHMQVQDCPLEGFQTPGTSAQQDGAAASGPRSDFQTPWASSQQASAASGSGSKFNFRPDLPAPPSDHASTPVSSKGQTSGQRQSQMRPSTSDGGLNISQPPVRLFTGISTDAAEADVPLVRQSTLGQKKGGNVKNPQYKRKSEAARSPPEAEDPTVEQRLNVLANMTDVIQRTIQSTPDEIEIWSQYIGKKIRRVSVPRRDILTVHIEQEINEAIMEENTKEDGNM